MSSPDTTPGNERPGFATSMSAEIAEYPDSDKVGVLTQFPAEGDGKPTLMHYIIRDQAGKTDYWEGE
jgi:hypothetical protein